MTTSEETFIQLFKTIYPSTTGGSKALEAAKETEKVIKFMRRMK